jgi:two-component system NtrC family sensor kinase
LMAFAGLTIYGIVLHRRTVAKIGLINTSYLPLTQGTSKIGATQLVFNTLMDRLADDPNQSVTREWIDAARRFRPLTLDRLSSIAGDNLKRDIPKDEMDFLREMRKRLNEVKSRYLENEGKFQGLYDLMDTGRIDEARGGIESLKRAERDLDRVLRGIGEEIDKHITALTEEAERDGLRATWVLGFLTLAALILTGAVTVSINHLLVPLKNLQQAVAKVARGDLMARIDVARHDEIGALAVGFNKMTEALVERDEMLIRSERLATTGKMAAQVTHEIRNPLSSLRLNAELLEEELGLEAQDSEAKALLKAMQDEIERLTGITESYLRFARLPSPEPAFGNLKKAVENALEFMKGEITDRDIAVTTELVDNLGPVLFDAGQIRQALTNLLLNACEAMPGGGALKVTTRKNSEQVELAVSDTGGGVPADALDHIFESFYSTKKSGTGLGLSLVRQICRAHGGDVRYERSDGAGATFIISLPSARSTEKKEV